MDLTGLAGTPTSSHMLLNFLLSALLFLFQPLSSFCNFYLYSTVYFVYSQSSLAQCGLVIVTCQSIQTKLVKQELQKTKIPPFVF